MKVALICPSNLHYMPYVNNYKVILEEAKISYEIINWDRLNLNQSEGNHVYRDKKVGHRRNFLEYYKFNKFVLKKLTENKYDKVIVFGIQLAFFLRRYLKKCHKEYIIDIRDYNKLLRYINIKKVIKESFFTVISSHGFKEWLPGSANLVLNHNTNIDSLKKLRRCRLTFGKMLKITYIGSLRDLNINKNFLLSLKNNSDIELKYHGDGIILEQLKEFIEENQIINVECTGRYSEDCESFLYKESDLINILIPDNDINSKTLLPNRLYNSVIYGKPIITTKGTYLSNVVKQYNLGLLVNINTLNNDLRNQIENFNVDAYKHGREKFISQVIKDNYLFKKSLIEFLK